MNEQNQTRALVPAAEEQTISRSVMKWINTCPYIPDDISRVNFEQFQVDAAGEPLSPSMALSVIQGTYMVRRYITGGHRGEYQFALFYRIRPGNSNDQRLRADETLNAMGDWVAQSWPELGGDIKVVVAEPTTRAALLGVTESGEEDHQILLHIIYEIT